jgi:hypothetical protein
MADYIPRSEDALAIWLTDHAAGVATHGATVGLTPAEVTQAATDATVGNSAIVARSLFAAKTQEVTQYKDNVLYAPLNTPMPSPPAAPSIAALPVGALGAIVARARQRADRIKAHPAYTQAIGEACRIVAPAVTPSTPVIPKVTAAAETDFHVRLKFVMAGHQVLEIFAKRGMETDFTLLALDTASPYVDGRPPLIPGQPETRQYRARFRDNDTPVGEWCDIITVTARA